MLGVRFLEFFSKAIPIQLTLLHIYFLLYPDYSFEIPKIQEFLTLKSNPFHVLWPGFPFLWVVVLVLNRTRCELWAWANKATHCQNLQVMGSPGGRAVGVAERHPDLHCVWKQGYHGNGRAWALILRVMGRLWKTLRKGGTGSGPLGSVWWVDFMGATSQEVISLHPRKTWSFGLWEIKFQ